MEKVIVYSTDDCIECEMVKKVLTEERISFEVRNISVHPAFQQEVERFGFLGVPVTVAGNLAVKGFTNELKYLIDFVKKG